MIVRLKRLPTFAKFGAEISADYLQRAIVISPTQCHTLPMTATDGAKLWIKRLNVVAAGAI